MDPDSPIEIVLFVGYPSSGKTSFYQKYFASRGYVHVNQDILRTAKKCLDHVELSLDQNKSCVVGEFSGVNPMMEDSEAKGESDNTNRNVVTRSTYIALAKKLNVPIRYAVV